MPKSDDKIINGAGNVISDSMHIHGKAHTDGTAGCEKFLPSSVKRSIGFTVEYCYASHHTTWEGSSSPLPSHFKRTYVALFLLFFLVVVAVVVLQSKLVGLILLQQQR